MFTNTKFKYLTPGKLYYTAYKSEALFLHDPKQTFNVNIYRPFINIHNKKEIVMYIKHIYDYSVNRTANIFLYNSKLYQISFEGCMQNNILSRFEELET